MTQIIDLGKLRFHFAGDWDIGTAYERNDIVKYGGNVYCYVYALKEAGALPTDTARWAPVVEGINFTGAYGSTTAYRIGDAMTYGGVLYVALKDNTGVAPPNAATWSQMADGISYQGAYSAVKSYKKNDVVTFGRVVHIAKQDTTGNAPTATAYWDKLVDGVSPQSVYNGGTTYFPNDLVAYGANIYRSITGSTGITPTADASAWELYVGGQAYVGKYVGGTAYKVGQVVTYGGGLFRAKVDTAAEDVPTDTAKFDAFMVGIAYMGVYSTTVAYKVGEAVTYGANLYRAKADTAPGDLPTLSSAFDLISTGFRARGVWAAATAYLLNDVVTYGGNTFICLVGHAAAAFASDLAAAKWQKFNGGVRWRGAWVPTTGYLAQDIVVDGTTTYIAVADYTSGSVSASADLGAGKLAVLAQGQSNVPNPAGKSDGQVITVVNGEYALADGKPKVVVISSDTDLVDGVSYHLESTGGTFNGTLPATPTPGARVNLIDGGGNLQGFPVTVLRNGKNINGVSDDLFINVNGITVTLTYINASIGWRIS